MPQIPYLMYHELELPEVKPSQTKSGYLRYVIKQADFAEQISYLFENKYISISVSEALRSSNSSPKKIVITFDDGLETDLTVAAPILKSYNYNATFFVVVDYIDKPGFLSLSQLREMSDSGFEIGCHSMSHRFLTDLDDSALRTELVEAKSELEQRLGISIDNFSCPGGRWNKKIASLAREAGYLSVSTSNTGLNSSQSDPFSLHRISILRDTTLKQFSAICKGQDFLIRKLRENVLNSTKCLLGNSLYEKIRTKCLEPLSYL